MTARETMQKAIDALENAKVWFAEYAEIHLRKGTDEAREKAQINAGRSNVMLEALTLLKTAQPAWRYDIDAAPLNVGLFCLTSEGPAVLSCVNEIEGRYYGEGDPRQNHTRMWRVYPDRNSCTIKPLCWMLPPAPGEQGGAG